MRAEKDALDFIVIGAQKAGTTSLFEYLRHHPQICVPADKEAPYFSHDALYQSGWEEYLRKAALVDPTRKWGTVSPQYMVGGVYESQLHTAVSNGGYDERTVPLRIRERLPDVRLVAILRDPVKRARSHHMMAVMDGFESRTFDQAIDELLSPAWLERARREPQETTGYIAWGEYGRILAGYFDVFPRGQIFVAFTHELESAPEELMYRLHEFLGVRADFLPENLGVRYRSGSAKRRVGWMSPHAAFSPQGLQRALRRNPMMRAAWHALPQGRQHRLRRSYDRFAYRVDLWNRRESGQQKDTPSTATLERLRTHFLADGEQLAELIGLAPPWIGEAALEVTGALT